MADQLDILMRLVAADAATPTINKVSQSVDKLDDAAKRGSKGVRDVGAASKETRLSLSQMETAVTGAITAFAGLQTLQFLSGMVQHGEAVRKTANTYTALTGSVQEADLTLARLRERTRGMVTDTELMAGAAQLLKTGLAGSNEEAVKLLGLSSDLGASTSELFSVLANQSYEVLDSFGVASGAVRQLKNDLVEAGMSSEEAFKQAFLVEAEKTVQRLGDSIEQNISPSEQLSVRWNNFWDTQTTYAATTLNTAITAAEQLVFILDHEVAAKIDGIRTSQGLAPINQAFYVNPADLQAPIDPYNQRMLREALPNIDLPTLTQDQVTDAIGGAVGSLNAFMERQREAAEQAAAEQEAALEANRKALEDNTRAIQTQSAQITGSVESLLGWKPPEQRELEGSQQSIRDALRRAGLSESELDQVMTNAQSSLPYYLQQGLTPGQAALRAYGVSDSTPGIGYDAQFTGQAPIPGMQSEAGGNNVFSWLTGLVDTSADVTDSLPTEEEQQRVTSFLAGLGDLAAAYQTLASETPMTFGGAEYNVTSDSPFLKKYGGWSPYAYPSMGSNFAFPGAIPPGASASPFNYASGATLPPTYQNMMNGPFNLGPSWTAPQPEQIVSGPANYGGMDYSSLPQYTGSAAEDVTTIATQSGIAADMQHIGAWSGMVSDTATEVGGVKDAIMGLTTKKHMIEFDIQLNQRARDNLTNFVFAALRSAGINVGGPGGGAGGF